MSAPVVSRPNAPTAYGFSTEKKGMLVWDEVRDGLAAATLYWIGTTRPDGSSQIHPIWGSWVDETGYFEGGDTTRWARNLARDPRVSFGVDSEGMHISGRGRVTKGPAGDGFAAVTANYETKYQYRPEADGSFWKITPEVIIALNMSSMESFATSPTRFTFST